TELKFFTKRKFTPEDPNYRWRKRAFFNYGRALMETGKFADSAKAFDDSLNIDGPANEVSDAEQLLFRGIALKKAGKTGFKKDWEEAASRGSKKAAELLEQAAV
ncbi:MAG: hypothetical protein KDD06_25345, partial [Phaeodactylibacter sp.]|nr:hypothetical protein [Phaeodactylibacter sp.]